MVETLSSPLLNVSHSGRPPCLRRTCAPSAPQGNALRRGGSPGAVSRHPGWAPSGGGQRRKPSQGQPPAPPRRHHHCAHTRWSRRVPVSPQALGTGAIARLFGTHDVQLVQVRWGFYGFSPRGNVHQPRAASCAGAHSSSLSRTCSSSPLPENWPAPEPPPGAAPDIPRTRIPWL